MFSKDSDHRHTIQFYGKHSPANCRGCQFTHELESELIQFELLGLGGGWEFVPYRDTLTDPFSNRSG